MSENDTKAKTPAYAPYKSLMKFINGLKENNVPTQIDRSMMSGMSGSSQGALISSLEFLNLISDGGVPTKELHQLVDAEENKRGPLLASVLERSYQFLFSGAIDLKRATTKQVEDAFREQGVTGSTIVKCMGFFLAAAKAAGIAISPHVKTPPAPRSTVKRGAASSGQDNSDEEDEEDYTPPEGSRSIKLPVVGKQGNVVLTFPDDFTPDDWKFLQPILQAYMDRMFNEQ